LRRFCTILYNKVPGYCVGTWELWNSGSDRLKIQETRVDTAYIHTYNHTAGSRYHPGKPLPEPLSE
jgi:hypothetical protein